MQFGQLFDIITGIFCGNILDDLEEWEQISGYFQLINTLQLVNNQLWQISSFYYFEKVNWGYKK